MMDVVDEGKSMDESCYYSVLEIRKYASYSEIRLRIASLLIRFAYRKLNKVRVFRVLTERWRLKKSRKNHSPIHLLLSWKTRYTCVLLSRGSVLCIVLNLGSLTLFLLEICPDLCISNHTCLNDICIEKVGMELKEAKNGDVSLISTTMVVEKQKLEQQRVLEEETPKKETSNLNKTQFTKLDELLT
ncbi:hypothetical protein L2E82_29528 [Cichorium intybus]|uniref:Uncharacterized protein n=1 Tax=Cichorium intybus TaxID=13427 RepID=A0ACB9CXQ8_CICIN|nr:hypothetical protein L2E82_29528 [Cichorium intybus]